MKKILITIIFCRSLLLIGDSCSIDQNVMDEMINTFGEMVNFQAGTSISIPAKNIRLKIIELLNETGLAEDGRIDFDKFNQKLVSSANSLIREASEVSMEQSLDDVAGQVRELAIKVHLPVRDPGSINDGNGDTVHAAGGYGGRRVTDPRFSTNNNDNGDGDHDGGGVGDGGGDGGHFGE